MSGVQAVFQSFFPFDEQVLTKEAAKLGELKVTSRVKRNLLPSAAAPSLTSASLAFCCVFLIDGLGSRFVVEFLWTTNRSPLNSTQMLQLHFSISVSTLHDHSSLPIAILPYSTFE